MTALQPNPPSKLRADRENRGSWLGVFGLIGPAVYIGTWLIAGIIRPGYDPISQAISELGEAGAATAPAMNGAFIFFGLTALPFAFGILRGWPVRSWLLPAAVIVTGLTTIGAAYFHCSPGCPGPGTAVTDTGHSIMATVGYVGLVSSPILAARLMWQVPGWERYARFSLIVGGVAIAGMLVWAVGLGGDRIGGLLQRGFNTVADIWWVATGLGLILQRRQRTA